MTLVLHGIGAGNGVAIGKAHLVRRGYFDISHYNIPARYLRDEISRYRAAIAAVKRHMAFARRQIPQDTPLDIFALVDVHLMLADDSAFVHEPVQLIEQHRCNAEWALQMQSEMLAQRFQAMDDPYLRARAADVEQVARRILCELVNAKSGAVQAGEPLRGSIVLAEDLTPTDAVLLHQHGVRALITETGAVTAHTAILARSLGMPTIVGLRAALLYIRQRELLIVDAAQGMLVAAPDERVLRYFRNRRQRALRARTALAKLAGTAARSRDGVRVALRANAELPEELQGARENGAEGIGLYRTEFLFLDRDEAPGEEEQLTHYLRAMKAMGGAAMTFRSVDLGADKPCPGREPRGVAHINPALGLRGIRRCLKDPVVFCVQLRAILRASAQGPVRLCIPMLSGMEELHQVLHWLKRAKQELDQAGLAYDPAMPVGAMIEVPAAAVMADSFAARLNFLAIGTNDLVQYTLAADRLDDALSYLYTPLHPAVLRLIEITVQAGLRHGIEVSLCGEMAADSRYTRLLLGLGLRDLSMYPAMLLEVKQAVLRSDVAQAQAYARAALAAEDAGEVAAVVAALNRLP